jgi:hypothetical protein
MAHVRDFLVGGPLAAIAYADQAGRRSATLVQEEPPPPLLAPVPAGDDAGTRVLAPPPEEPPPTHRRGPSGAIIAVFATLAVILLFLLFAWLFGAFDPQDSSSGADSSPDRPSQSSPASPDASPSATTDAAQTERAMASFITDYVALAVDDPHQSWNELTPEFQQASGGFGQYQKFWDQWESASVSDVRADAGSLTASYTATYVRAGKGHDEGDQGDQVTDDVTLVLEPDGNGSFLIAAER